MEGMLRSLSDDGLEGTAPESLESRLVFILERCLSMNMLGYMLPRRQML